MQETVRERQRERGKERKIDRDNVCVSERERVRGQYLMERPVHWLEKVFFTGEVQTYDLRRESYEKKDKLTIKQRHIERDADRHLEKLQK